MSSKTVNAELLKLVENKAIHRVWSVYKKKSKLLRERCKIWVKVSGVNFLLNQLDIKRPFLSINKIFSLFYKCKVMSSTIIAMIAYLSRRVS